MQLGAEFNNLNPLIMKYLYDVTPEELVTINSNLKNATEDQVMQFCTVYRSKRKDPQLILILTLIGFFGVAGIQRFILGQIGMGILYFFTGGLCLIGTIVDAVNYKSLALEYNSKMVAETMIVLGMYR
jgi:TM2 domain-containing membrane protein YozV